MSEHNPEAICAECGKRFKEHTETGDEINETFYMCGDDWDEFSDTPKDKDFLAFLKARNSGFDQ